MMDIAAVALLWGAFSAVSLPLGAVIGIWTRPPRKVTSSLMAFGGGALLFALTIELFAHALHRSHEGHDVWIILVTMAGAVGGGLLFEFLNQMLNSRGAFLRKASQVTRHIVKNKRRQTRRMVQALSRVGMLQVLPPEEVARLIPHVRILHFKPEETLFNQGDPAAELYFIVSGSVRVLRETASGTQLIAELGGGDTFGEIGLVSDQPRTATVRAKTAVTVYSLSRKEFDHLVKHSPDLREASSRLATERLRGIQQQDTAFTGEAEAWAEAARRNLDRLRLPVTERDLDAEIQSHGGGAALAIWMGIALDGIPESLVIGMLVVTANAAGTAMSLAFIAGVFMANLPEAMSSAVTMKRQGARFGKIFWMWMSLCLMTGLGAAMGALAFPAHPSAALGYFVAGIEGLAAGAMLTMIAETMLPEAFEQGGGMIVGLSTLFGFLAALGIKVSSLY